MRKLTTSGCLARLPALLPPEEKGTGSLGDECRHSGFHISETITTGSGTERLWPATHVYSSSSCVALARARGMASSLIPSICWVPKGAAKEVPDKVTGDDFPCVRVNATHVQSWQSAFCGSCLSFRVSLHSSVGVDARVCMGRVELLYARVWCVKSGRAFDLEWSGGSG